LRIAAYAISSPNTPPAPAVIALSLMLAQNDSRRFAVRMMSRTLLVVKPPWSFLNAPIITTAAGKIRNMQA
jgi:hypothetical protein